MLYQTLLGRAAESSAGYDIEQMHIVLDEDLAIAPFAESWTLVARRHPILSSSFRWEGVARPVQEPNPSVIVPVEEVDLRGLDAEERERRLGDLLEKDRARGFDPARAPLMRVTVLRVGEGKSEVVWTYHHVLLDGRSATRVLVEVFRAHAALAQGSWPDLPPPPRPYRAYIEWLATLDVNKSKAFYRELLRGKQAPTPLPLAEPAARPLPAKGYGAYRRLVRSALANGARAFVERTGTTMGTLVHAAWALVLARTTGHDDVLFGATRACRRSPLGGGAIDMVGLLINSPPLRVRVDDDRPVSALLAAVRAQNLALRDHEHTALVDIQGESEIPRGTPLFETLLMFENRERDGALRAADPAWNRRRTTLHEQPSPPLAVTVLDGDELTLRLLYDRRRFRDGAVARLAAYLEQAIAELSRDEHRAVGDVDILPPDERDRVLTTWNDTARAFPRHLLIHERFEQEAAARPHAIALEVDGAALTYGDLDARANRLAHLLVARGAGPGHFVGICLARGVELVIALLAVAKSGAAYVPLDPGFPAARLAFLIEDARAWLVITEERFASLLRPPLVVVDGADAGTIAAQPTTPPPRRAKPTDACYAIYTSGSTGEPKGVVLTHDAVQNTFDWVNRTFDVGPRDRVLFVTSPCFDLSVWDTFGALGAGATVVIATSALLDDPEDLARAIADRGITIWDSAPAALERLVPFFPSAPGAPLRLVLLSGDWIPLSLPGAVRAAFPRARVVSLGGATEAAIWSNWFPIGDLDPRWTSVPYGRPIQNARYHVLDARMRPVPIGAAGDLYIGGACLARGYLGRPALTAERFVPDPFARTQGERLYRTGDLARYFDDGNLEFLGRSDFQVKIRGYRVELGEVDAALAAVPGVRAAVAIARPDASGQKSLVGYVVPEGGATLDAAAVKSAVAARLADYMVPAQIAIVPALPLTATGKVDRNALPPPAMERARATRVPPRSDLERKMTAIWREILRVPDLGVTDNFFALGGHSLLAVMLVSRVERDLGVKLRLSRLLERPTIAELCAAIEDDGPLSRHGPHVVTLSRAAPRPPLVLVSGAGGFGFVFRGLSAHLAHRHPVHVLNAIGAEDESEGVDHRIEEMAEIYVPEVLAACPSGPIVIGGYSSGVLVAFELASRLVARGRRVPLLVSFDGFAPGFPELLPLPARLYSHAKALLRGDARAYARDRLVNLKGSLLERLGRGEERFPRIPAADEATDRRLRRVEAALWRARSVYRPARALASDLLLLKTTLSERWLGSRMDDPFYGWRAYLEGKIEVVTLPGKHLTVFEEPNQRRMAEAILAATAALDPGRPSAPADPPFTW